MSTILRAGETVRPLKNLRTIALTDHVEEMNAVLERAKRSAAKLIQETKTEKQQVLQEARKEGHQKGYEEGLVEGEKVGRHEAFEEATKKFDEVHVDLVQTLTKTIEQLDEMKENLRIAAERDALEFAILIARKLTFAIGDLHRDSAMENFHRALQTVGTKTDLIVRINPRDRQSLETFATALHERINESARMSLREDESISPGGCKVENESTSVDASLDTQVEEIVDLLLGQQG